MKIKLFPAKGVKIRRVSKVIGKLLTKEEGRKVEITEIHEKVYVVNLTDEPVVKSGRGNRATPIFTDKNGRAIR